MTTPVSIGDAIQLSKITYRLIKILTTERAQVPSTLQEIQKHLADVQAALSYFGIDHRNQPTETGAGAELQNAQSDVKIDGTITNCLKSITELKKLIDKYDSLNPKKEMPVDAPKTTHSFRQTAKDSWKRIRFILEHDDLKRIMGDLSSHTDSLNLAVTVTTKCSFPPKSVILKY